jgi:hypothetical protein
MTMVSHRLNEEKANFNSRHQTPSLTRKNRRMKPRIPRRRGPRAKVSRKPPSVLPRISNVRRSGVENAQPAEATARTVIASAVVSRSPSQVPAGGARFRHWTDAYPHRCTRRLDSHLRRRTNRTSIQRANSARVVTTVSLRVAEKKCSVSRSQVVSSHAAAAYSLRSSSYAEG